MRTDEQTTDSTPARTGAHPSQSRPVCSGVEASAPGVSGKTRENPRKGHVSLARAAQYLGVSTKTVKRRIKSGELEGFKWSPTFITISWASIENSEAAHRMGQTMRLRVNLRRVPGK